MLQEENELMWRRRLARCGLTTLVDTMQGNPVPEVQTLAGEELDRQLLALGYKPTRRNGQPISSGRISPA